VTGNKLLLSTHDNNSRQCTAKSDESTHFIFKNALPVENKMSNAPPLLQELNALRAEINQKQFATSNNNDVIFVIKVFVFAFPS
jgi:hypothetical protein